MILGRDGDRRMMGKREYEIDKERKKPVNESKEGL